MMTEVEGNAPKLVVVAAMAGTAPAVEVAVAVVVITGQTNVVKAAGKAGDKAAGKGGVKAVAHESGTTAPAGVDKTAGSVAKAVNVGRQRAAVRAVVETGAVDVEVHSSRRTR